MRELLIATGNKGKIPGMLVGLQGIPFEIRTLADIELPSGFVVEEPGSTYEAHAVIKAIIYGKKADMLTIADDSGIEIDALSGWPGVHAATWLAGSAEDRMLGLLEQMKDIPNGERGAQYRSVIAIFDPVTEKIRFAEGTCRGSITVEPKGTEGFGYDPIFFSDDLQAVFAEMPLEDRAKVSHRARSIAKAREILLEEFV